MGGLVKPRPTKKQRLTARVTHSTEFSPRAHKLGQPSVRRVDSMASFDTQSTVSMRTSTSNSSSKCLSNVGECTGYCE